MGKNYIPDTLMTVFRQGDRYEETELIAEYESLEEGSDEFRAKYRSMLGYKTTARTLRERLRLMGFSPEWVRSEALDMLRETLADEDQVSVSHEKWLLAVRGEGEGVPNVEALLDAMIHRLHEVDWMWPYGPEVSDLDFLLEWTWEEIAHEKQDPRFILALLLRDVRGNCSCTIDLTDLAMGGWLNWPEDLVSRATSSLQMEMSTSGKIIVLTEGSTDVQIVRGALQAIRPDVSGYFTFLDFAEFNTPGGTDRVVSLAKGLASASVMNRVVVVLDNDTAGREAELQLSRIRLPPSFAVMRLPDQRFAERYPTLGPSGSSAEDINRRACSIEFMFGADLMRAAHGGALPPVRWKSYIAKVGDYQGEVTNKTEIQKVILELIASQSAWPLESRKAASLLVELLIATAQRIVSRVVSP